MTVATAANSHAKSLILLCGGPGKSPTSGEINDLQMVRVKIASLSGKED
jgi:hypothetical protein